MLSDILGNACIVVVGIHVVRQNVDGIFNVLITFVDQVQNAVRADAVGGLDVLKGFHRNFARHELGKRNDDLLVLEVKFFIGFQRESTGNGVMFFSS